MSDPASEIMTGSGHQFAPEQIESLLVWISRPPFRAHAYPNMSDSFVPRVAPKPPADSIRAHRKTYAGLGVLARPIHVVAI